MRYIVFGVILFLPLIAYFTWAYVVTRKRQETGGQWNEGPITRLFLIGLVLMGGALVVSRFMNPGEAPTRIVPERYQDDRFLRQAGDETAVPPRRQETASPPPSPQQNAESLLAEDRAFLKRARRFLDDFVKSDDIELLDTLVTKSDRWGPVLRADYRRRIEGRSQPRERIVIWEGENGMTAEFPDPVGLAPLSAFASELSFPLESIPGLDEDAPPAPSAD